MTEFETAQNDGQAPYFSDSDQRWLDTQANSFASSLLLPSPRFEGVARKVFQSNGLPRIPFVIDNQPFKNGIRVKILSALSDIFHVSMESVDIRLKEIGYFQYIVSGPKRLNDIF